MENYEKQLMDLIDEKLDDCCPNSLPNLKKRISRQREVVRSAIFDMCLNEGIGVQLAMTNLDSELNE